MEDHVFELVRELMRARHLEAVIDADTSLWDVGFESIDFVRLLFAVERRFELTIPETHASMENFLTVRLLSSMLALLEVEPKMREQIP